MRDAPEAYKKRYVDLYGDLRKHEDGEWVFIPKPDKENTVVFCKDKSKWAIIDLVYDLILDHQND